MPPDTQSEDGFRALMVPGPIPFEQTGVLASIAKPLAAAGISIFAISTYDTDYVLVRAADLERALAALEAPSTRQRVSSGSPYEPVIGFSRAVRVGDRVLVSGTTPGDAGRRLPGDHARPGAPLLGDRAGGARRGRRVSERRRAHAHLPDARKPTPRER